MKNLLIFMIIFSTSFLMVQGQNEFDYDQVLEKNEVLKQYRGEAADTVSTNQTTFTYTIFNEGQEYLKESFTNYWEIAIDSVSGTAATVSIAYQRRKNIFNVWVTDSTQIFGGTQSDTTLVYYDSSAKPDPYRRIKVTYGSGFKVKIDWLSGLFLLE